MDTYTSAIVIGLTTALAPDMPAPSVPVQMQFVRAADLSAICGPMKLGCARLGPASCSVWIMSDILTPLQRIEVIRHELAHCAGWHH